MSKFQKVFLLILRLSMGWLMLYSGITKILNPEWSAEEYLQGAKTFSGFYEFFLNPTILPIVNIVNEWGLTLLGVSLIFGVFVRLSSVFGAALMLLYYFPVLEFPMVGSHSFIIDDHIVYALVLILLAVFNAGKIMGFDKWFFKYR